MLPGSSSQDDGPTIAQTEAPTPDGDATIPRAPAPTLDEDATIARADAAARGAAPANRSAVAGQRASAPPTRPSAPRGGDRAMRPSLPVFHVDDDPTRISTPPRFPIARLSRALAAKKSPGAKQRRSRPGPAKQRGRWSPRAAIGAAAGALLLSMLGVTAIIVVSARGCGGAQSAPACGANCGESAP